MTLRPVVVALMLALGGAPAASAGDPARGQKLFERCAACHSVDPAQRQLPGPNLHGVVDRPAATSPDFDYSPSMVAAGRAGLVWTEQALDAFLADSETYVPGNWMGLMRISDAGDRDDLIAFLKQAARRHDR
ncbi:MAG TPA: cytochrome c family protein [Alphaproteobacteria bacterium]